MRLASQTTLPSVPASSPEARKVFQQLAGGFSALRGDGIPAKGKKGESFSALIVREAYEEEIQVSRSSNVFAGARDFLHRERSGQNGKSEQQEDGERGSRQ
jgi:hypothetical protein